MASNNHTPESGLKAVELRLSGWQPNTAGLQRDSLLFEAGRASAQRAVLGPAAGALVLAVVSLALGTAWWSEHAGRETAEKELARVLNPPAAARPHELDEPPAPVQLAELAPHSYLALRQLLSEGGEALAAPTSGNAEPSPDKPKDPSLRAIDRDFEL